MKFKCEKCGWENSPEKVYCENCKEPLIKDVFISYSRKDYTDPTGKPLEGSILFKIKTFLTERGLTYWFDEEGIFSGDEFSSVLTQAIRSSKVFLFVSSVNSNQSPWTSREIAVALMYKKVIIPFKIDDSPYNDAVAMKVAELDRIDYYINNDLAMAKLERALRHHLPIPLQTTTASSVNKPEQASRVDADIKEKPKTVIQHQTSVSFNTQICIPDKRIPIAMMIGLPSVGKTMTLMRLSRYLIEDEYVVLPERSFRSSNDAHYDHFCESFQYLIHRSVPIEKNDCQGPSLIRVKTPGGNDLFHLIDVPGEVLSFDFGTYPPYFNDILCAPNPKAWMFFFELRWGDIEQRMEYARAIGMLYTRFAQPGDRVIIVINKIDKLSYVNVWDVDDRTREVLKLQLTNEYPGVLDYFQSRSVFWMFRRQNCSIVPFMTGLYNDTASGSRTYSPSPNSFSQTLFNVLMRWADIQRDSL